MSEVLLPALRLCGVSVMLMRYGPRKQGCESGFDVGYSFCLYLACFLNLVPKAPAELLVKVRGITQSLSSHMVVSICLLKMQDVLGQFLLKSLANSYVSGAGVSGMSEEQADDKLDGVFIESVDGSIQSFGDFLEISRGLLEDEVLGRVGGICKLVSQLVPVVDEPRRDLASGALYHWLAHPSVALDTHIASSGSDMGVSTSSSSLSSIRCTSTSNPSISFTPSNLSLAFSS
jgi:hypothetical protein